MTRASAERTKTLVLVANAYLGRYREVLWLIGDGRSGTTWVSSVINHHRRYREMFEPFHPRVLKDIEAFRSNGYIRPDDQHESLRRIAARVFSGKLTHRRVDRDSRPVLYRGLLVKDVFANLFAYWVRRQFPDVKILLLIRNPFMVALSKLRKREWSWTTEPLDLLNQPDLFDDFLRPLEDLIRTVSGRNDYVQNQILIWSILNWVPLVQFRADDLHVVFYEDMLADPEQEVTHIMRYLRPDHGEQAVTIPSAVIHEPSWVTAADSPLLTGVSAADAWKNELTTVQIDAGFEILSHFGFDALYRAGSRPDRSRLTHLRRLH